MRKVIPRLLVVFALALCFPVMGRSAQKPLSQAPAAERHLIAIKATGSKRYSEADIAAATGLQIGTPVTDDDFKKAARRLGDMGVFTDVAYSYSYSAAGTKVEFKLTDGEKFVPVRFEDFVWFSDAELLERIKERAPLFDGQLPLSGRLPEQVSDILQGMLVERAIPGHVDFTRSGPSNGPVDSIVYQVSDVLIQVRNIEFTGAAESETAALKAASERLTNREYSRTTLNALVQKQLLPVYYARGYLKAKFGAPEPKVAQRPSTQGNDEVHNLTTVDVIFPVTPGRPYKLTALDWSGNQEFSTEQLAKMVRAQPGQPANTVKLGDNLKDVQKLYGSRGYVSASITPQAEFDDTAGTVAIRLEVKEGAVYHMGDLEFRGLDNSLTSRRTSVIRPSTLI